MTINQKLEALQNALISYNFPERYFVQSSDKRLGHKFAIARKTYSGGIHIHTNYMNYDEFNAYLQGYRDGKFLKFQS